MQSLGYRTTQLQSPANMTPFLLQPQSVGSGFPQLETMIESHAFSWMLPVDPFSTLS